MEDTIHKLYFAEHLLQFDLANLLWIYVQQDSVLSHLQKSSMTFNEVSFILFRTTDGKELHTIYLGYDFVGQIRKVKVYRSIKRETKSVETIDWLIL